MANSRLIFGRGINAAVRTRQVNDAECSNGENFDLDLDFAGFRRRRAFDTAATATNALEIRGFAQLVDRDGVITTLVQAGNVVYSWDGSTTFTQVGTVPAGSKLRGHRSHIWNLGTEVVIVTDLAKLSPVLVWDGTSLSTMSTNLGAAFYAKYCLVDHERAFFANVTVGSTVYPHLILGSKLQDYTNLSTSTRSLVTTSSDDPFYLPVPDLRPINGMASILGSLVVSSERGQTHRLIGTSSFDFEFDDFYLGSNAVGDEALVSVGNDLAFGRAGVIESLSGTDRFGDVETDDVSRWIKPLVSDVTSWSLAYDSRRRKLYCLPSGGNKIWVCYKSILDSGDKLSPWSRYTTAHSSSFQPVAMMSFLNPVDGLENVYLGGPAGQIFQMDGEGGQDAGSSDITAYRLSGMIDPAPGINALASEIKGYVDYARLANVTLTLTFIHQGLQAHSQVVTKTIPVSTEFAVYGGSSTAYYDGTGTADSSDAYYGEPFPRRLSRQTFSAAGQPSYFQVRAEVAGANEFEIDEIGLDYGVVKQA